MSRHIFGAIKPIFNHYNKLRLYAHIFLPVTGLGVIFHLGYILQTETKKKIYIVDKYLFTQNGYTNFMIVDNSGAHYNVNNSFWFWKWDSIEDWQAVQLNEPIFVTCYGLRIPELGLFPNIVSCNS